MLLFFKPLYITISEYKKITLASKLLSGLRTKSKFLNLYVYSTLKKCYKQKHCKFNTNHANIKFINNTEKNAI